MPQKRLARQVEYRFPVSSPAGREVAHLVKLAPGAYLLEATLIYAERTEAVTRAFTLEREERITLRL